ncbi:MAG: type 1 glutamine amidotransferase [Syntrophobacteraceae bacterium]
MIAIIQNDPDVPPGTLIGALGAGRHEIEVIRLYANERLPDLSQLSAAVVLGGAMSVKDADTFPFLVGLKAWIREILGAKLPFLGICLGGQLLAEVSGGRVLFRTNEEYGCKPVTLTDEGIADPLFKGISSPFVNFHYHTDCFVPPKDAVHLARTAQCRYQGFRVGPRAYGLQFHPEVDRSIVFCWADLTKGQQEILEQFEKSERTIRSVAAVLFKNFLDLAQ